MHHEISRNKRKVPDSNYIVPIYNRSINHQHTNSLPVDSGPLPQLANISGSIDQYREGSYQTPHKSYLDQYGSPVQQTNTSYVSPAQYPKQEPSVPNIVKQEFSVQSSSNKILNKLHQNTLSHNISHHVKTFSLPVIFKLIFIID